MHVSRTGIRVIAFAAAVIFAGCGKKPSREFDGPPIVPQVPRAQESSPDSSLDSATQIPAADRPQWHADLPLPDAAPPPVAPGNAPWGPTATYVPVKSPREIPGEKVKDSPSQPVLPAPMVREIRDPSQLPPGTPFLVAPPAIEGAMAPSP